VDFITGIGKFYKLYTISGYAKKTCAMYGKVDTVGIDSGNL